MKDKSFIRGEIPMTKSEVRAVSLSKLEVECSSIIYDIGAGTGSVSVEAALLARMGHVYAFEQKEEGCALIRANAEKHGVKNLTVVSGRAPESLDGYPVPDRVFVGGTGGSMEKILDKMFAVNPKVRIVLNVIALESLQRMMEYVKSRKMKHEIISLQVAHAELRAGYHMMQGQNPVFIITLEKSAGEEERVFANPEKRGDDIPRILVAAASSGSGKTVLTMGLLALLKKRGHHCVSFKCGPDYIDPMFHQYVLKIPGCNLDSFFLEKEQICDLFCRKTEGADFAVIEGVMGYYDGVAGNSVKASTYEIACITDTPVILVLDGKKSSLSLAAQLHGFMTYQQDSHIAGVILNRTSPVMLERLRPSLEKLGVRCLGAVPECSEAELESRHLGLTIPSEQQALRGKIDLLAEKLEHCLDVEAIERLGMTARSARLQNRENKGSQVSRPCTRRMAVAADEAFCFYYQENFDFLKEQGWELVMFSPLHDQHLPVQLDCILLGGGYPEVYAKELSENQSMICDIREAAKQGVRIMAECGGFLYLHNNLESVDGVSYPMAGLIPADGFRTERLSRFGYIALSVNTEAGCTSAIRAHEFHYWDSSAPGTDCRAEKPGTSRSWACMYVTNTMLAGFPHLYYLSNPEWIKRFLEGESV